MRKSLLSLVVLGVVAVAATGCGGSSGGGGGGGIGTGSSAKTADSAKLANCLNNDNWISAPSGGDDVNGSSAAGANFDIRIHPTAAEAKAAAAKLPKKSTAVVGTSVVTFIGAPTGTGPGQPVPIPKSDLATIKTCYAQST
jgi:hypothetical protein